MIVPDGLVLSSTAKLSVALHVIISSSLVIKKSQGTTMVSPRLTANVKNGIESKFGS